MDVVFALGAVEVVAYTGTAAASTTTNNNRGNTVRVYATTDCHITTDGTTATTSKSPSTAGVPEYLYRPAGALFSVIRSSADGNLFITELSV